MMFAPITIGGPFALNLVIAADTLNFNLRTAALAAGWNGVTPLKATVTVNSGIYVGSASTGTYAFDTDTGYPTGSSLSLINNGLIVGCGGGGGYGSNYNTYPAAGNAGGPALLAQTAIAVANNGTIGGGGGGGGGGIGSTGAAGSSGGGGGGGGRGYSGGGGGAGGASGSSPGDSGGSGTKLAAGNGGQSGLDFGSGPTRSGGYGGNGGGLGSTGSVGGASDTVYHSAGGAPGAAIAGDANITWVATGTRLGSIS